MEQMDRKLVIAITGASGAIYAKQLLDFIADHQDAFKEVSVVMSDNAKDVWFYELENRDFEKHPFTFFSKNDFMAPFASGSAKYTDMVIIPCSMGTLGRIASGISNDLITRTADVMLKERRKLILVARETPLSAIHLEHMLKLSRLGVDIVPPIPAFYQGPKT